MNNDRKPNPDEAAKRLQSMVSLGIPDTRFTEKEEIQPQQETQTPPVVASTRRKRKEQPEDYRETYFRRVDFGHKKTRSELPPAGRFLGLI